MPGVTPLIRARVTKIGSLAIVEVELISLPDSLGWGILGTVVDSDLPSGSKRGLTPLGEVIILPRDISAIVLSPDGLLSVVEEVHCDDPDFIVEEVDVAYPFYGIRSKVALNKFCLGIYILGNEKLFQDFFVDDRCLVLPWCAGENEAQEGWLIYATGAMEVEFHPFFRRVTAKEVAYR